MERSGPGGGGRSPPNYESVTTPTEPPKTWTPKQLDEVLSKTDVKKETKTATLPDGTQTTTTRTTTLTPDGRQQITRTTTTVTTLKVPGKPVTPIPLSEVELKMAELGGQLNVDLPTSPDRHGKNKKDKKKKDKKRRSSSTSSDSSGGMKRRCVAFCTPENMLMLCCLAAQYVCTASIAHAFAYGRRLAAAENGFGMAHFAALMAVPLAVSAGLYLVRMPMLRNLSVHHLSPVIGLLIITLSQVAFALLDMAAGEWTYYGPMLALGLLGVGVYMTERSLTPPCHEYHRLILFCLALAIQPLVSGYLDQAGTYLPPVIMAVVSLVVMLLLWAATRNYQRRMGKALDVEGVPETISGKPMNNQQWQLLRDSNTGGSHVERKTFTTRTVVVSQSSGSGPTTTTRFTESSSPSSPLPPVRRRAFPTCWVSLFQWLAWRLAIVGTFFVMWGQLATIEPWAAVDTQELSQDLRPLVFLAYGGFALLAAIIVAIVFGRSRRRAHPAISVVLTSLCVAMAVAGLAIDLALAALDEQSVDDERWALFVARGLLGAGLAGTAAALLLIRHHTQRYWNPAECWEFQQKRTEELSAEDSQHHHSLLLQNMLNESQQNNDDGHHPHSKNHHRRQPGSPMLDAASTAVSMDNEPGSGRYWEHAGWMTTAWPLVSLAGAFGVLITAGLLEPSSRRHHRLAVSIVHLVVFGVPMTLFAISQIIRALRTRQLAKQGKMMSGGEIVPLEFSKL